jgi:nitrogen regulatory protein PII-like uncharacterized protein
MGDRKGQTQIHLRLPSVLIKKIDRIAKEKYATRTYTMIELLMEGIKNEAKKTK